MTMITNIPLFLAVGAVVFLTFGIYSVRQRPSEQENLAKRESFFIGMGLLCLVGMLFSMILSPKFGADSTPVGTIISSYLPPPLFSQNDAEHKWMLANGDDIPTSSKLFALVQLSSDSYSTRNKTPDLRGMFLRGISGNRNDGKQDPETRLLGSYQLDDFKQHDHGGGAHTHEFSSDHEWSVRDGVACVTGIGKAILSTTPPATTSSEGAIIKSQGGSETRPRNVAVYYYIKIN